MGEVIWLEPEPALALPAEYARLGATVRRALDELAQQYQHVEKKYEDACWVGSRLTELLPIELNDKQALLELDDPVERLEALIAAGRMVPARSTGRLLRAASVPPPENPADHHRPAEHHPADEAVVVAHQPVRVALRIALRGLAHHVDHGHPAGMQADAGGDVAGELPHQA